MDQLFALYNWIGMMRQFHAMDVVEDLNQSSINEVGPSGSGYGKSTMIAQQAKRNDLCVTMSSNIT